MADSGNHTIRKITPAGAVTTLAGNPGRAGSSDGTGSEAGFCNPQGVAVDEASNVYVGDTYNSTIRKMTPAGAVTTLAGSAGQSRNADGMGSSARFSWPMAIAVDGASNIYVADSGNDTVRKIAPSGAVTTLAGNPWLNGFNDGIGNAAQFFSPQGVAVDSAGNVYVAEETDDMIRRITPSVMVTTLAGSPSVEGSTDGIGSKALFYGPVGVAVDSLGNLFVADANNLRITKGIQAFLEFNPSGSSLDSSNNSFRAWLTGPPTCAVIVEASTNLISWLPIQTNSLPAGGLSLSVPLNANPKVFPSHTVKALSCWASFSPKACLG